MEICNKCDDMENCTKYCVLHAGKALVNFLNNADMTETKIGDKDRTKSNGPIDLIVSGHQLWDNKNKANILTKLSETTLCVNPKFKTVYGVTASNAIKEYANKYNVDKDVVNEAIEKIQLINRNRLLVIPFKPHTYCDVEVVDKKDVKTIKCGFIKCIKWSTNKETYKLDCVIEFELRNKSDVQRVKLNITDYMNKFKLSQMELQSKSNKIDKNIIEVDSTGIIKPIVIKNNNCESIAIDGTYLYYTSNGITKIIGYWGERDEVIMNYEMSNSMIEKFNNNKQFIANHKNYIAPYILYEANEIKA